MTKRRLLLGFALLSPLACPARAESPSELAKSAMEAGLDKIFAFDFDGADREFDRIAAENPRQPYGYFGRAGTAWARFVYGSQQADLGLEREFEGRTDLAIGKAEAWLKMHPRDVHALLCLGGAYGLRSRLAVIQKHWIKALNSGRKAIASTREAAKIDPGFPDAYLGIGMWEYYADVFPRFIKLLGNLLLGGNRLKGIRDLTLTAKKGRYANVAAQLLLIEIYTEDRFGAKDPRKALALVRRLRERYPNSPIFQQIEQICYYAAGDLDGVVRITQDYMRRIDRKTAYYPESDRARMYVALGTVEMARRDFVAAREDFSLAASRAGDKFKPSRWGVWGLLRLGQVEDQLGQRPEAKRDYHAVLDFPDLWGFHSIAREHLGRPFSLKGIPRQLPPP